MKKFEIPNKYRSNIISKIKAERKAQDPRKKDFTPTFLEYDNIQIILPRHFGFCFGVENAIEIAYQTLRENPNKTIYLLSQMIHNPHINKDLKANGIHFIQDTYGNQLIEWDKITKDDIVIIPAFGTSIEIEKLLIKKGIETKKYNTTCPFVERVWKKSAKLGADDYSIIIHGKFKHEETRATFSHSKEHSASVVIFDMEEAQLLGKIILGEIPTNDFYSIFDGKYSEGFDPEVHLKRIGVVNQTTMLATETQNIANYFKNILIEKYGEDNLKQHFADTRDTLCYATNDNQSAILEVLKQKADLALVIGGYNSSNTTHLVELCEPHYPTYFINSANNFNQNKIQHFDIHSKEIQETENFLNLNTTSKIIITSGASCPDSLVEEVIEKLVAITS